MRSPDDLRPLGADVPREVSGLVGTLNSFMGRLSGAISGLRNFTGNASHQLRTPMTIVRTQLALAGRSKGLKDIHAATRKADDAVVQAERVLAQLLLLARIDEAASQKLQSASLVNLSEIAATSVADRVLRADAAGIDLGFEDGGTIGIQGEPLLLGELIGNLIDNAVAYGGDGAVVTVRTKQTKDGAVLEVEDNGPGIAADRLAGARRRFARGTSSAPGTGLGLSIVDEIATLFHGKLLLATGSAGKGLLAQVVFETPSAP
jgi:two-component system sensor histidine kinase TctE